MSRFNIGYIFDKRILNLCLLSLLGFVLCEYSHSVKALINNTPLLLKVLLYEELPPNKYIDMTKIYDDYAEPCKHNMLPEVRLEPYETKYLNETHKNVTTFRYSVERDSFDKFLDKIIGYYKHYYFDNISLSTIKPLIKKYTDDNIHILSHEFNGSNSNIQTISFSFSKNSLTHEIN
ncbi:MAG: hypothetical protein HRT87_06255 [Legionellales bacterium]|nr:hypothetical protein [Legionellales bacterium]